MCWILAKEAKKPFPFEYIKQAQTKNEHGYGVSWYDGETLHTFKTLDFEEFVKFLKEENIEQYRCVLHLRNTTVGANTVENCHPFELNDGGVMFHNGTISSLKKYGSAATCGGSDTKRLADLINSCKYTTIEDIRPIIQHLIGDTLNRLVFFGKDGSVKVFNHELGIHEKENGYWMSNDYHIPAEKQYVFVYGTLKEGYSNHITWMEGLPKICKGETKAKWAMVTYKGWHFPYMLRPHSRGHNVIGEIYEVEEWDIYALDQLEGYPNHYKRQQIQIVGDNGKEYNAITYVKTKVDKWDFQLDFQKEF